MNARTDSVISRVPLLVWVALLLAVALAAVIVLLTVHDTAALVLAIGALLATTAAMLVVVRAELTEEEAPSPVAAVRPGHARLAGGLALLAVVMLAVGALLVSGEKASSSTASDATSTAVQTVRDYVTAAALDQDGDTACGYLSAAERLAVARLAGPDAVCREAFTVTQPAAAVPASVHEIRTWASTATVSDGQARVVLGQGAGALTFRLRLATPGDANAYGAPSSAWRITAGATSVFAP